MREPDKKRFLNAVQHIESEGIPLYETDADMSIVNRMMDKDFPLSLHPFELPAADVVELNRKMGNDMVYFSHVWRVGRKEKADAEGRRHYVDGEIKNRGDLDSLWFPDLDEIERKLVNLLEMMQGTRFGLVYGAQTAPFTSTAAIGYEDFCIYTIEKPEFIHEVQKRLYEYVLREMEMAMRYPIDAVKIGSGLVINTGPMLSPTAMEEFEFALLREQAGLIKRHNLPLFFHIDGQVTPMIPQFLEMGVDVLNPIDPCSGGQDIFAIKEQYGDQLTLCGNIDIDGVLLKGTREEVAADVKEHIDRLAQGGGYIAASSHNLHQLIPLENIYAFRDAVHAYRFSGREQEQP